MIGQCTCGACAFRLTRAPIVTHACHCTWCQRETGGAFAINAVVETTSVEMLKGAPVTFAMPSQSGKGQVLHRCSDCGVTLWSNYAGSGPAMAFVRVGTLEPGHGIVPDVHIFTSTKLPWVPLPEGAAVYEEFYSPPDVWGAEGLARFRAAREAWV